MRILLVYDCLYPDSVGGIEHRNHELARALGKNGHQVTVAGWTRGHAPEAADDGVRTERMRFGSSIADASGKRRPLAAAWFALAAVALSVREYDVVEAANIPYLHLFPLASKCARAGVPFVVSWYEYWGDYFGDQFGPARGLGFAAIERAAARLGTECCAVSRLTASRLARVRGEEVPVVPAGIHFDRLEASRRTTPKTAASLVYAGRLIEEKRVALLLEALPRIVSDVPETMLTIVGEGPERPRLEALSRSLGIADRVHFTGRLRSSADVFQLVAGASLAVQLSRREGFGMFPLEAMALGTPIVHCESSESAVGELVGPSAGIVVSADPGAVAGGIARLLSNAALLDEMRVHAVERARRFDWSVVAERFEELVGFRARSMA
jgi:glycosyltransferase involved in cell wall biosynthesis